MATGFPARQVLATGGSFVHTRHFQPLYDADRQLIGVWLSPELWLKAERALTPAIDQALAELEPAPPPPEPMADWENLAQCWDFKYPMPFDVACENCGNTTPDWREDEPRKFRLRSANLGGLANFQCQKCQARIIKKHFKDHVDVQCRPFVTK